MRSSAPPRAALEVTPGFRLDRYEVLCLLAQGGMAAVWLGRLQGKHGFEKLVAIKTILPNFAMDANFRQMFLDEARIASGIHHPNVVQILELGDYHDTLYLVMELVEGDPLRRLQRACERDGKRIPLGIALKILSDTCAGLHAAHELCGSDGRPLNVVHRDVSPQNVMVTTAGVSKVIDFGIAKARERGTLDTQDGSFKGKVAYMPREQVMGGAVDRRADLWSVGAVLYHLITGHTPYTGDQQLARVIQLVNTAEIEKLPADVPEPVRALVMRALEHDVSLRFQTAAELQAAIDEAMIQCGLSTSNAQVAAFVAEHLRGRVDERRRTIELALKEAAHRAMAHGKLVKPLEMSPASDTPSDQSSVGTLTKSLPGTPPVAEGSPGSEPRLAVQPFDEDVDIDVNEAIGTETLQSVGLPTATTRRRRASLLVAAVVLGLVVVGTIGMLTRSGTGAAEPVAGSPPSATSHGSWESAPSAGPTQVPAPTTAAAPSSSASAAPASSSAAAAVSARPGTPPPRPPVVPTAAVSAATPAPTVSTPKKDPYGF